MGWIGAGFAGKTGLLTLLNVRSGLRPVAAQSATIAITGRVLHTGTNVRAAYRWQPAYLVTAVDPYAAFSDQAYLSFFVRQPVNCGRLAAGGAGGDGGCDQSAGAGVSAVPVGGWTDAVSGAVSAESAGWAGVQLLAGCAR